MQMHLKAQVSVYPTDLITGLILGSNEWDCAQNINSLLQRISGIDRIARAGLDARYVKDSAFFNLITGPGWTDVFQNRLDRCAPIEWDLNF